VDIQEALLRQLAGEVSDFSADEDIPVVDRTAAIPLSWAQQRLWFMYVLDPSSVEYNVPVILRLRGELDVAALRRAVHGVVERHASLRTTFDSVDGQGVQHVRPVAPLTIPLVDLADRSPADRESEVNRWILDAGNRPFDLRSGPVFRANIVRLGQREHLLVLSMHHIVTDGWSLGVLMSDLSASYSAEVAGEQADLPPLSVAYADFASWQRGGTTSDQQIDYWRRQLDGLSTLDLVTGRDRRSGRRREPCTSSGCREPSCPD
jgi:hypothetical protein